MGARILIVEVRDARTFWRTWRWYIKRRRAASVMSVRRRESAQSCRGRWSETIEGSEKAINYIDIKVGVATRIVVLCNLQVSLCGLIGIYQGAAE